MACVWGREISSCSCLTFLPGPAWLLLNKMCIPLFWALYLSNIYLRTPCNRWRFPTSSAVCSAITFLLPPSPEGMNKIALLLASSLPHFNILYGIKRYTCSTFDKAGGTGLGNCGIRDSTSQDISPQSVQDSKKLFRKRPQTRTRIQFHPTSM